MKHHSEASEEWHKAKGNEVALCVQHLEDLIQYYMEQRNVKKEIAVKQLLRCEEVRNLHFRHSTIMTRLKPNMIKTLLVPRPYSEDPHALMKIKNPDHIQQIILTRNATKLGAAHGLHFTVEPLATLVGPHGDTSYANDILKGKFSVHHTDEWTNVKYCTELKLFLQHMKRPLDAEGNPIPDMK